jgi:hypothetical protein
MSVLGKNDLTLYSIEPDFTYTEYGRAISIWTLLKNRVSVLISRYHLVLVYVGMDTKKPILKVISFSTNSHTKRWSRLTKIRPGRPVLVYRVRLPMIFFMGGSKPIFLVVGLHGMKYGKLYKDYIHINT